MRLWDVSIAATAIQCLRPLRRRPRVRQRVPQKNLARISQVVALRVAAFAQTFEKRICQVVPCFGRLTIEEVDHRHRRLLREPGQRPCDRGSADETYKFSSPHGCPLRIEECTVAQRMKAVLCITANSAADDRF